jgi:hypothetical protein
VEKRDSGKTIQYLHACVLSGVLGGGKSTGFFEHRSLGPLKKFSMRGVEERGVRRTLLYAVTARDDGDKAGGAFSFDAEEAGCSKSPRCEEPRNEA